MIVAQKLTDNTTDDASLVHDLLNRIQDDEKIARFTGAGAYDQNSIYETFAELGARVVVPPFKTTVPPGSKTRAGEGPNPNGQSNQEGWPQEVQDGGSVSPPGPGRTYLLPIQATPRKPTPRTPTRQSNELRPDSPATYSTTCSSSEHPNFRRSKLKRERRQGISAEFDLCNNATHRGERFVRDCLCLQAIPSPGGLLRENGSDVFWRTAG